MTTVRPVTTASSSLTNITVKAVTPVTTGMTLRLAFRPRNIAAAPRITYASAVASQAIAPRTAPTSLVPTNLTPVVVRRGPDPERELSRLVPVPVTLQTTRLTLTTSHLTNLSQRDPISDRNTKPSTSYPKASYEIDSTNLSPLIEPLL